jgi:hypothetical protein
MEAKLIIGSNAKNPKTINMYFFIIMKLAFRHYIKKYPNLPMMQGP